MCFSVDLCGKKKNSFTQSTDVYESYDFYS